MPTHADENGSSADLAAVTAIARGDQAAFARLIDRESPRLLRFARGILGGIEESEDVVQETLLTLWEQASRWKPEARIGTWLHRVCYNRCIDRLRRRRAFVDEAVLKRVEDGASLPDAALVHGEIARSVREAVERLPPRQRSAVLLFHFQDVAQSDAAAIMGVTESAFESLLARARRQMRAWLAVKGGGDE